MVNFLSPSVNTFPRQSFQLVAPGTILVVPRSCRKQVVRKFDMHVEIFIISAGKNIYPEDVEDVIGLIEGVIPGRVVAFGQDDEELGTDVLSVVAETCLDGEKEQQLLKMEIMKAARSIDVTVTNIYLVPPRWLIKSSAGKPGRNINKERILIMEENKNKERRTV